jgi:hypothetical protein
VLVLFVGIGHEMKVVLIMVASLFPILLNTYGGVRSIDPVQLDTARTLGLTTWQTLREVVLPAARKGESRVPNVAGSVRDTREHALVPRPAGGAAALGARGHSRGRYSDRQLYAAPRGARQGVFR